MIVVADTSPLNYLILIDAIRLLKSMYERIAVPEAVRIEMARAEAPASVQSWALTPPAWVDIHGPVSKRPQLSQKARRR